VSQVADGDRRTHCSDGAHAAEAAKEGPVALKERQPRRQRVRDKVPPGMASREIVESGEPAMRQLPECICCRSLLKQEL